MSDKVDVFMPLYVQDFLRDTDDLSPEEFTAYTRLLLNMWSRGGELPDDPERLSRLARFERAGLQRVWPVVGKYFRAAGGAITQKRLTHELARARKLKAAASDRGRQMALARWGRDAEQDAVSNPAGTAEAIPTAYSSPSESESIVRDNRQSSERGTRAGARPRPPNGFDAALSAFCEAWQGSYGEPYLPSSPEKSNLGRLLQRLSPVEAAELPRVFRAYLADSSRFVAGEKRHSLAWFLSDGGWNKYRTKAVGNGRTGWAPPAPTGSYGKGDQKL